MSDIEEMVKRLRAGTNGWNSNPAMKAAADVLEAQAKRIAELEASLADSNEALQVMGLKLEQAEGHSANTVGGPTPVMDAAPACERNQVIKECAAACAEFVNKWNQTSIDRLQAGRTSDSLLWAGHAAGANLCHGAIMALMANCSNEDTRTESDS